MGSHCLSGAELQFCGCTVGWPPNTLSVLKATELGSQKHSTGYHVVLRVPQRKKRTTKVSNEALAPLGLGEVKGTWVTASAQLWRGHSSQVTRLAETMSWHPQPAERSSGGVLPRGGDPRNGAVTTRWEDAARLRGLPQAPLLVAGFLTFCPLAPAEGGVRAKAASPVGMGGAALPCPKYS